MSKNSKLSKVGDSDYIITAQFSVSAGRAGKKKVINEYIKVSDLPEPGQMVRVDKYYAVAEIDNLREDND